MKICNNNLMDLNRETAMRLWVKTYGKETKVHDFAGRTMVKGAYNDRNSDYGWNVDHIFPQSKGGVTADHNLVCCHILTNDEKADKFPCFTANNVKFEILKVQNHYEIKQVKFTEKPKLIDEDDINFFDSAAGIRYFKKLKGVQNKKRFVGSVFIRLTSLENTAVVDFIEKIFEGDNFSYEVAPNYDFDETRILIQCFDLPLIENTEEMLDKCILLNTYLEHYFRPSGYLNEFDLYFRLDYFKNRYEMYSKSKNIHFKDPNISYCNGLMINKLAWENTEAKEKVQLNQFGPWTEYNYIYTKLANNLDKEVNEK